jgi:hypothetical protein
MKIVLKVFSLFMLTLLLNIESYAQSNSQRSGANKSGKMTQSSLSTRNETTLQNQKLLNGRTLDALNKDTNINVSSGI